MATWRDWLDLGKSTVRSLKSSDLTNLYVSEWPETQRMLVAEHAETIAGERRRLRRWLCTLSSMLYGLAKKLAPHRRVIFLFAWIYFFVCLCSIFSKFRHPPVWTFVELTATFFMITVLLAMELIDKLKFRDELELARDLQADLIPKELPRTDSYELAAFNLIANTVGGDIYDFVPLPDGRLAVLFGDASGHGMAAGLVMAVAHAAFRTQLDVDPSPLAISSSLNRILCRTGGSRSFFSCCYLLLEPNGDFLAVLAGHPPMLRLDRAGRLIERVGRGSYPLGVKTGLTWEPSRGNLAPGERLLLHSDGLTEARNAADKDFGDPYVEVIAGWHPDASPQALVDSLVGEWSMFMGGRPTEDDVSIAVVARR